MGLGELVGSRQIEPDLEEFQRVRPVLIEQRHHFGVLDAAARGEPLGNTGESANQRKKRTLTRLRVRAAAAVTGHRAHGVMVVYLALCDNGDRLKATVRVRGEAGHAASAVIHAEAVLDREIRANVAAGQQRRVGHGHAGVASWKVIFVVHAEEERIDRLPHKAERADLRR